MRAFIWYLIILGFLIGGALMFNPSHDRTQLLMGLALVWCAWAVAYYMNKKS